MISGRFLLKFGVLVSKPEISNYNVCPVFIGIK